MAKKTNIIEKSFFPVYETKLALIFIFSLLLFALIIYFLLDEPLKTVYFESLSAIHYAGEIVNVCIGATLLAQCLILGIILFFIGLYASHRLAGPMYRMLLVSRELKNGKLPARVKFRKTDRIHQVAEAANEMTARVRRQAHQAKAAADHIKKAEEGLDKAAGISDKELQESETHIAAAIACLNSALTVEAPPGHDT